MQRPTNTHPFHVIIPPPKHVPSKQLSQSHTQSSGQTTFRAALAIFSYTLFCRAAVFPLECQLFLESMHWHGRPLSLSKQACHSQATSLGLSHRHSSLQGFRLTHSSHYLIHDTCNTHHSKKALYHVTHGEAQHMRIPSASAWSASVAGLVNHRQDHTHHFCHFLIQLPSVLCETFLHRHDTSSVHPQIGNQGQTKVTILPVSMVKQ